VTRSGPVALVVLAGAAVAVAGAGTPRGTLDELPGEAGCIQRRGRSAPESPPCATVPVGTFAPSRVL
jgi:hypothetical protein